MTRRWRIAGALALAAGGLGTAAALTEPPMLLSIADAVAGGGRGTERVATGVAFGRHGQRLDVWRPTKRATGPLPVVIFWHGGGWVKGTRGAYAFAGRALASQGFVVVVPDYRKVPDVRFPAFVVDAAQAVLWTRDHAAAYGGDPKRIALSGHSAGAYAAVMLALDRHFLRDEGVDPAIVKAAVGLSGPYDFHPFTSKRAVDAMAAWPDPRATQPVAFARADAPPLLLVTSSKDTVVRPRNARALTLAQHRLGAPVEYRSYTGLSHEQVAMALSRPFRGTAPVLADTAAFLHRSLR